jgi:hypothetical protein
MLDLHDKPYGWYVHPHSRPGADVLTSLRQARRCRFSRSINPESSPNGFLRVMRNDG